ncbi:hypothetical protein K440DRAFT_595794 [Wilcoxina mikolae CBS 423.85]|nr:hypothetical protein K440DRAFT_595794 [Wilcoxina mikolae CBS 423.85]
MSSQTPTKQWADGPFPLMATVRATVEDKSDHFVIAATHMACIHNVIIRCLNSIYLQAPHVPPSDYADFITYAQHWSGLLHAHHEGEEHFFFPSVEEYTGVKGIMEPNVEQHKAFSVGLDEFDSYLSSITPAEFSGQRLNEIIDTFAVPLTEHLTDEIPTIMGLKQYEDKVPILDLINKEGQQVMAKIPKTTLLAIMTMNLDHGFEGGIHTDFPPAPWFVKLLMRWIWPVPNRKLWRFASCTAAGVRRELPFAPAKGELDR